MSRQTYERIKSLGTEDNGSNINIASAETGEREVVLAPMDDALRRFIALVDECYDSKTNLVMTAYVPQDEIYTSGSLMFEFERSKRLN
jgi:cell division protein ZapE